MIPKTIHYCWFGNGTWSPFMKYCRWTWEKYCPNYVLKRWDESNSPLDHPYLKSVLKTKNWSKASDFVRLYALLNEGGIYLDVDIELFKNLDPLLEDHCFMGWQDPSNIDEGINGAILGSLKAHKIIDQMMQDLLKKDDGSEIPNVSGPKLLSEGLIKHGLKSYTNKIEHVADVTIYPKEYFYPFFWNELLLPEKITKNTYCLHHWSRNWGGQTFKKKISYMLERWSRSIANAPKTLKRFLLQILFKIRWFLKSPLKTKDDLPLLLNSLGIRGEGVVFGVDRGRDSDLLLTKSRLSTLSSVISDECGDRQNLNSGMDIKGEASYMKVLRYLSKHRERSRILRMNSEEACEMFSSKSLEFLFFDWSHLCEDAEKNILFWWPKLKDYGVCAGEDCPESERQDERRDFKGTMEKFAKERNLTFCVTPPPKPIWYFRKNSAAPHRA